MKFRYFANVMARIDFEIEAPDEETADELAKERVNKAMWDEFTETGGEIGRYVDGKPAYEWDEVLRYGDI